MIESMILQKFISEKNWKRKQAQRQAQIGKKATIPSQKKSIKKKVNSPFFLGFCRVEIPILKPSFFGHFGFI